MAWLIRLPNGEQATSDDFTLNDLGEIEKRTGEYWSTLNPLRTLSVAREFIRVAYERNGFTPDIDNLTLGDIKAVFDFKADEPFPGDAEAADDTPLDLSSRASSRGGSGGSSGRQRKRAASA